MPRLSVYPPGELSKEEPAPRFLMLHTQPRQLWLKDEHYIETDNRRATPGKVYHFLEPNQLLRVVDILEADESITEYQVEDAHDTVVIEYLYDLNSQPSVVEFEYEHEIGGQTYPPGTEYGGKCDLAVKNQTEGMLRYQIETPEALSMGDIGMVPFESVSERNVDEIRDQFQAKLPMDEAYIASYETTVQIGDWFYSGNEPLYKIVGIDQVTNSDGQVKKTELIVRNLDGTHSIMIAESILYSVFARDDSSLDLRSEGPDDEIAELDLEDIENANERAVERHHRDQLKEMGRKP